MAHAQLAISTPSYLCCACSSRWKEPAKLKKAKDEKAPLSEIIEVLNERFGTQFSEEDRLFFLQIKEKACNTDQVVRTALANPLDKFELGVRKLIEDLMIERITENDEIVTRYMADRDFQGAAFPVLAREIFKAVRTSADEDGGNTEV